MSGNLKLNTTSGGSIALAPTDTASTITVTVPAVNSTLNTSGAVNTVPAGSVSAPAITTTGDTNTGIFFPAADTIAFTEGGVESMRIDSSGNVGIGTSSPTAGVKLDVRGSSAVVAQFVGNNANNYIQLSDNNGTNFCSVGAIAGGNVYTFTAGYSAFYTGSSEKMRLDSSGNLLVGTTSATTVNTGVVSIPNPGEIIIGHPDGTVSTWGYMGFKYNNSLIGSITQSGTTAVLYNTTSDHRLKTNIVPLSNALNKIMALKPSEFEWVDGRNDDGFIAHELQAVLPNVVTGDKDAVDEDGNPKYQQVDYSRVVATLTAAIQEQQALITQLQADVAALKGAA